jgi:hypothetical protein
MKLTLPSAPEKYTLTGLQIVEQEWKARHDGGGKVTKERVTRTHQVKDIKLHPQDRQILMPHFPTDPDFQVNYHRKDTYLFQTFNPFLQE